MARVTACSSVSITSIRSDSEDRITTSRRRRILRTQLGWAPDERTLQRNFHRLGLTIAAAAGSASVFGVESSGEPWDSAGTVAVHATPDACLSRRASGVAPYLVWDTKKPAVIYTLAGFLDGVGVSGWVAKPGRMAAASRTAPRC